METQLDQLPLVYPCNVYYPSTGFCYGTTILPRGSTIRTCQDCQATWYQDGSPRSLAKKG